MLDGRSDPAFLLYSPTGPGDRSVGFIYVTDSAAFVRQLYGGQLRSVAGTGDPGYAGDNGFATSAKLTGPHDLAFDTKGSALHRRRLPMCAKWRTDISAPWPVTATPGGSATGCRRRWRS